MVRKSGVDRRCPPRRRRPQRTVWMSMFALLAAAAAIALLSRRGYSQDAPSPPPWNYSPEALRPFWQGTVMQGESVLFILDEKSGEGRASVLFPIRKLLQVTNSAGDIRYEEGRDFLWSSERREIRIPPKSRIPVKRPSELRRPAKSQKYELTHRDGNGEIFFGANLEYAAMQTCVSYEHAPDLWKQAVPRFNPTALPKSVHKLLYKKPLSIVVIGDSISAGCNASGWANAAPFQPAYPELLRRNLEARFVTKVSVVNPSVSGTDTQWVMSMIDKVVEPKPDLVVVAFGMNDSAGRPAAEYKANTQAVIAKIRERMPDVEFILVASMLGNRDWIRLKQELFPQYRDALASLCGEGVALADLTSIWAGFLESKQDWDQTGNGVNHPNDFGHRVYAQVLSALLTPEGDPKPGTDEPTVVRAGPLQFAEQVLLDGHTYSYACAAADLDGDGDLDLTNSDAEPNSNLYLLRNDGQGKFHYSPIQKYAHDSDQAIRLERHSIGDVNGDGHPDVVIVDNQRWDLCWYENPGPAKIEQPWPLHRICAAGDLPGAYDVALADLDGDGDLDAIASSWRFGNRFDIFENPGRAGNGATWKRHALAENIGETRTIAVADFNRDGKPDVLGSSRTGNKTVWYANPGGSLSSGWRPHIVDESTIAPVHGHPVDMDGDGDLDILMAFGLAAAAPDPSDSHQVAWYENVDGAAPGTVWKKHRIEAAFPQGFEAVAGDLDGDGDLDVVATGWGPQGRIAWFENTGDPRSGWRQHAIKVNWSNAVTVILADIDHDGRLDIVACAERGANELRCWRNLGR